MIKRLVRLRDDEGRGQLSLGRVHRARVEACLLAVALVAVIVLFDQRKVALGPDAPEAPIRVAGAVAAFLLGWALIRHVWPAIGSTLLRRGDPQVAASLTFLVKAAVAVVALIVELHILGVSPAVFAIGGAFAAIVIGFAAQPLVSNAVAGAVLLSAKPFAAGDSVRFQGGAVGGQLDGMIMSFGLLYLRVAQDDGSVVMLPNSVAQQLAVMPLREPISIGLRVRLSDGIAAQELQALLADSLNTPLRNGPRVVVEGSNGDHTLVSIEASPLLDADRQRLTAELVDVIVKDARCSLVEAVYGPSDNV